MLLAKRNFAASPLFELHSELDRLSDAFFGRCGASALNSVRAIPALNVREDDDNVYVEAEVPGMKLDELELTVQGDAFGIKGSQDAEQETEHKFHRRERVLTQFARELTLPSKVDADATEATLKDGVLTVKLPKAADERPRKIEVKSA